MDDGRAKVDLFDLRPSAVDFHRVADLDRPLEKQDDAADEIVENVLQAEPQSDAQGAEGHGQGSAAHAEGVQRHQYPQAPHQVDRDADHRILQAGFQPAAGQHPGGHQVAAQTGQQVGEKQDQGGCQKAHQVETEGPESDGKAQYAQKP